MGPTVRPRRSVLYTPASSERALEKARVSPADGVIVDLEDGVAPSAKETARERALAALRAAPWSPREVILRVNGAATPWGDADLAAAATSGADAVLLPKVEDAAAVRQAEQALATRGAPAGLAIWCMLETPLGVLRAAEIAGASPRIAALVMGTTDLVKDLGARATKGRLEVLTSLSLCLLVARAFRLAILDGVHLDIEDDDGFEAACRQAVELGFAGKTLIHPRTIAACTRIFTPSQEDVAWSRRVIDAHAQAEAQGRGVAVLDGQLIEALHVDRARRTLALAEAVARRGEG